MKKCVLKSVFKVSVIYDRFRNDVEIHLDKQSAEGLVFYLRRSIISNAEQKDVKFIAVKNTMIDLIRGELHLKE